MYKSFETTCTRELDEWLNSFTVGFEIVHFTANTIHKHITVYCVTVKTTR